MNTTNPVNQQALLNTSTSTLAKPSGSMPDGSKKNTPEILDKMTSDDLVALVNIIVLLISGVKSPSAGTGGVGGSPFNSSSGSNFILDFPTLPTMNHSSDSDSGSNSSLKFPPLPSLSLGNTGDAGATGTNGNSGATGGSSNSGNVLNTRPLPSLVSSSGSLSTAGAPRAFNPPAIPSLLGNSTQLPSVNAADSSLSTGLSTSPQESSAAGSSAANSGGSSPAGNTVLATNQLPSLVSSTGSLSTPDVPKAFNPPLIPSLTGNSSELPLVSASDSQPITSGLSSSSNTNTSTGSSPSNSGGSSATIFNVPAIPSLLGSGGTIGSLVASLESGASSSTNTSGSGATNTGDQSRGPNSHFTSGS